MITSEFLSKFKIGLLGFSNPVFDNNLENGYLELISIVVSLNAADDYIGGIQVVPDMTLNLYLLISLF